MSYPTTTPMPGDPDYPVTQGALPVWQKVYTKPSEQTFLEITAHPEAKAKSAYFWVFIAGALSGLINSVTRFILALVVLKQSAPEIGELPPGAGGLLGVMGFTSAICAIPIAGASAVAGFALSVAVVHATARFFGGQGNFDKLAYAFGAVTVPLSIISAFLIPFNAIRFGLLCTIPILLVLGLYAMFLQVTAVKAVHQCGWGEAAAAYFMPTVLIVMLCGLLFVVLMKAVGPEINQFMQEIQRLQQ